MLWHPSPLLTAESCVMAFSIPNTRLVRHLLSSYVGWTSSYLVHSLRMPPYNTSCSSSPSSSVGIVWSMSRGPRPPVRRHGPGISVHTEAQHPTRSPRDGRCSGNSALRLRSCVSRYRKHPELRYRTADSTSGTDPRCRERGGCVDSARSSGPKRPRMLVSSNGHHLPRRVSSW